jgi:uncharacterized membrane protein
MADATFEKAMKLAVVTGLRTMLGPALVAHATSRPEQKNLALAALAEMVADKLPLVPSRDSLLPLVARGFAGAWVAHCVQQESGEEETDPWVVPLGAAVAMGVAVAMPKVRKTLSGTTGVSDTALGLIEDYVALRLGGDAVGLSMDELAQAGRESIDDLKERIQPALESVGHAVAHTIRQSAGAGSM